MDPWLVWLIIALIFFVLEMFAADFIVASVGVGCLMAGAASLFGISLQGKFLAFITGTLALMLGVRPRIKAWLYKSADPRSIGTDALLGQTATIVDPVGRPRSTRPRAIDRRPFCGRREMRRRRRGVLSRIEARLKQGGMGTRAGNGHRRKEPRRAAPSVHY